MNFSKEFLDFDVYQFSEAREFDSIKFEDKPIVALLDNASNDELILLGKIIQAVGKNLATDVFVINQTKLPTFRMLNEKLLFEKLLVFGINPKEIGLHINARAYDLTMFQEKQILFSHGLSIIAEDLGKKKSLWGALQEMFKT